MSGLNPNAASFTFNPTASSWSPGSDPTPPPEEQQAAPPEVDGGEEVDEDDPLWKVTLKLAGGDRQAALKLLEDPDALMRRPEVLALLEEQDKSQTEDWEDEPSTGEAAAERAEAGGAGGQSLVTSEIAEETQGVPFQSEGATAEPTGQPGPEPALPAATPAAAGSSGQARQATEEKGGEQENEVEDEDIAEGSGVPHLNIVFIGHVDAGKSTLSGNILYLTGHVDKRTVEKYEQEAKDKNRESWFLAFIMDTNDEERAKGKTVEVGRAHFATELKRFTILDAPGHKSYVPNMIQGASQADVGILVISARKGEFETGFERGGQTREHALLAKTLGVAHLIVVINKMDDPTVEWNQGRFDECCTKLKPFLKQCGFRPKFDVRFIPISGLTGGNVLEEVPPDVCPWWRGYYTANPPQNFTSEGTLLSMLNALEVDRDPDGPLRIPVLDRYTERGTMIMGKVESGIVRRGQRVCVMPGDKIATVQAVYCDDEPVSWSNPGENVKLKLGDINLEEVMKGFIICGVENKCSVVTTFRAQVALVDMLEHRPLFTSGYTCMFHAHCVEETVVCTRIGMVKVKGEDKRQRFARQGNMVSCELQLERSCCLETYETMAQLGRFTLRDEGQSIGIGKVIRIMN